MPDWIGISLLFLAVYLVGYIVGRCSNGPKD